MTETVVGKSVRAQGGEGGHGKTLQEEGGRGWVGVLSLAEASGK